MKRMNNYSVRTLKRWVDCKDLRSAEYIYGCNKHAELLNNGVVIRSK